MKKGIAKLALGVLFTAATMAMHGTAGALIVSGSLDVYDVDIWDFQCTSSQTRCMTVRICDDLQASADVWEATLGVYYPTKLLGQGDTVGVYNGSCSSPMSVCRPGATEHGPTKALLSVNHPWGPGKDGYKLTFSCHGVNGVVLPASATKLKLKN
jgi:hypothetical protein